MATAFFMLSVFPRCVLGQGFVDVTEEAGLSYIQQGEVESDFEVHLQSGGAVAGDFDGDGWTDLFVTRFQMPDILFRNLGPDEDGFVRFEDVSAAAGFTEARGTNGAVAVDVDNDRDLDLYVTTIYENTFILYINQGDGTFVKDGGKRGANLQSVTRHLGFSVSAGDYDRDGWPDMHTSEWNISVDAEDVEQHSVLLRNFGADLPGWFENATEFADVTLRGSRSNPDDPKQFAFSSSFVDMDGDGWQDLVVAADFASSQLFWNTGLGFFYDGTRDANVGHEQNGMGLTVGDFDGDGLLDFFVSSIGDHKLYRNLGDRIFAEEAEERIEGLSGWGWGSAFFDFDNDGDLDLSMTTGYEDLTGRFSTVRSVSKTRLWENEDGYFADVGADYGIVDEGPGKGLLVFDYDKDGDLDMFIVNAQSRPILYRNDVVTENDWIRVTLRGRKSNRDALGARLKLWAEASSAPQLREIIAGSNFLAQNELTAHFGLGELSGEQVHSLSIDWPSGLSQSLSGLKKNRAHVFFEPLDYEAWQAEAFLDSLVEESERGPERDPDEDGLTNLYEYALALDPLEKNGPAELSAETELSPSGQRRLVCRYRRLAGATDAAIVLEGSANLTDWEPMHALSEVESTDIRSERELVKAYSEIDDDFEARFLRLRVESVQ